MKKLILVAIVATGLMAEVNLGSCAGCHGADWSKKALGTSKVVSELTNEEIKTSLLGYKDGSYGGAMKGVMKGQVTRFSEQDIEQIANQIKK